MLEDTHDGPRIPAARKRSQAENDAAVAAREAQREAVGHEVALRESGRWRVTRDERALRMRLRRGSSRPATVARPMPGSGPGRHGACTPPHAQVVVLATAADHDRGRPRERRKPRKIGASKEPSIELEPMTPSLP
jgi:hypothetical protein